MKKFLAVLLLFAFAIHPHEFDFSDLVKDQSDSVVNIQSVRKIKYSRRAMGGFPEDLFREFGFPVPDLEDPRQMERESVSTGSGFVIDKKGYVITNYHVVQDADEVVVKFLDRREFKAEIVGMDELSDLALLKIETEDLDPVELGNSDQVEQGDGVIAIGSPYNYDFSVTFGIISATGRGINSGQGIGDYVPYLQTDAAVNRGNSGGPLFNTDGEVIGINSQIFSRSGGNEGLAFAIPINIALEVVDQLKSNGRFARGYLGVGGGEVSSDLAEALGMEKPIGALVRSVVKDGAADKGGVLPGDVIVKVGKKDVIYFDDLRHAVGMTKPNTNTKLKLFRDGEYMNLYVKVGELPSPDRAAQQIETPVTPDFPLGLNVENIEDEDLDGVKVMQVTSNSPAYGQIIEGDLITQIRSGNTTYKITDVSDFQKALDSFAVGDKIAIFGTRDGSNFFVAVTIE
tara:strand:+ start:12645 stop:14015 length:1371 start_codon:yes stop_codon:yes gene_type:complete